MKPNKAHEPLIKGVINRLEKKPKPKIIHSTNDVGGVVWIVVSVRPYNEPPFKLYNRPKNP
jgi:hypothetical protein